MCAIVWLGPLFIVTCAVLSTLLLRATVQCPLALICLLTVQSTFCHARSAALYAFLSIFTSCIVLSLYGLLSRVACAIHAICVYIDALCRLWSTKQEQEKVPDEEATKRKQDAADAKVRCITHPQSLIQLTLISQSWLGLLTRPLMGSRMLLILGCAVLLFHSLLVIHKPHSPVMVVDVMGLLHAG